MQTFGNYIVAVRAGASVTPGFPNYNYNNNQDHKNNNNQNAICDYACDGSALIIGVIFIRLAGGDGRAGHIYFLGARKIFDANFSK